MARFSGLIGFVEATETSPGVWINQATERRYMGDVTRNIQRFTTTDVTNGNISMNNMFSIVASDNYINEHLSAMRYIEWEGTKWTITSVEVQRPRLLLSIGEIYHGDEN